MEKRISLFKVFGNNIVTRNSMSSFFEEITDLKFTKVILDFSNITFISRSCADEYLKQRKKSMKDIVEVNMSKNICQMFDLVSRQYKKENVDFLVKVIPESKNRSLIFS